MEKQVRFYWLLWPLYFNGKKPWGKDAYLKLLELFKNTYSVMRKKQVFVYIRFIEFVICIHYNSLFLDIWFCEFWQNDAVVWPPLQPGRRLCFVPLTVPISLWSVSSSLPFIFPVITICPVSVVLPFTECHPNGIIQLSLSSFSIIPLGAIYVIGYIGG